MPGQRQGTTVVNRLNGHQNDIRELAKKQSAAVNGLQAQQTTTAKQIAAINATLAQLNITALANFTSATNTAFLAALSQLAHQTTANSNITNSNSALTSGDAAAINGVINALNNLQSHLQSDGYEA